MNTFNLAALTTFFSAALATGISAQPPESAPHEGRLIAFHGPSPLFKALDLDGSKRVALTPREWDVLELLVAIRLLDPVTRSGASGSLS
jgi:hypothetical protein